MAKNTPLNKQFLKFVWPSVLSMWVYSLYTMVDGIFVGHGVGPDAIAAVNVVMPFVNVIFSIGVVFATGASTIISMSLGMGDTDGAHRLFSMMSCVVVAIGIFIAVVSLPNLPRLVKVLGATPEIMDYSVDYLRIVVLFGVFLMFSYYLEIVVKTDGFPHLAIIGAVLSGLTNVVLDYLFIMRFGWGVKGAAIATGIAQVLGTLFYLKHFIRGNSHLRFTAFHVNWQALWRVCGIGFSAGITEVSTGLVILMFNKVVFKAVGESGLITYGVISYVKQLVFMTVVGIGQGIQPLISFYHGRRDDRAVNYLLYLGAATVSFVGLLSFASCMIFAPAVVAAFFKKSSDVNSFTYTVNALRMFSTSFLLVGYNVLLSSYFTAVAQVKESIVVTILRGIVAVCVFLLLMTALFGDKGIWYAELVSETVTLLMGLSLLNKQIKVGEFQK
ncbi:MAG TPA: MATE family efflux transporter [Coprothermobacter sp.]|nr:MATE family efflux transporter [Coprothermobacter sp.]